MNLIKKHLSTPYGVVIILMILGGSMFVFNQFAQGKKPVHTLAHPTNCATTLARPCFERETNQKIFLLDKKAGANVFAACIKSSKNIQNTITAKTAVANAEKVSVCNQNNQIILRKFQGTAAGSLAGASGTGWTQISTNAPWITRADFASLNFGGKMWVIGGASLEVPNVMLNDVWSSSDGVTWTEINAAAPWIARGGFGSTVFKNKIWIFGGQAYDNYLNDVWSSSDGVTWTEATDSAPWNPLGGEVAVVFNNQIWLLGGFTTVGNTSVNEVWHSSDGVNWTRAADAPWAPRINPGVAVFNNKLWVLGGQGNIDFYNDVWSTSDGSTWTQESAAAAPLLGRSDFGTVVYNAELWVMGGFVVPSNVFTNDVWHSADGVNWIQGAYAPWPERQAFGATVFNNAIWVLGGQVNNNVDTQAGAFSNDVWSYQ